ncbi:MAG: hypothetical protein OEZ06_18935 [Myxococcales bacterium]|nr:hypothetical protein [Myxococcales bacterium]
MGLLLKAFYTLLLLLPGGLILVPLLLLWRRIRLRASKPSSAESQGDCDGRGSAGAPRSGTDGSGLSLDCGGLGSPRDQAA